jgi:hypothetical protein
MKPKILPLLALLAATLLASTKANAADFSIAIVGHSQDVTDSQERPNLPVVYCPKSGLHDINGYAMDPDTKHCFYVVLQNEQTTPTTIKMAASAWHESMQFKITDSAGKVYTVEREPIEWIPTSLETWNFTSSGPRTIPIDFMTGWAGLPPPPSAPEAVTMTATFTYYDTATHKPISISSKPTAIVLAPEN